jgi:hypothetical protein
MFKTELTKLYDEWKSADYVGVMSYSLFGKVDEVSILNLIETSDPHTTDAVFFNGTKSIINHANVGIILTECMLKCKMYEEKYSAKTPMKLKFLNLHNNNQQSSAKIIFNNIADTDHAFCNSFMTKPKHMLSYIDFFVNTWLPLIESHPLIQTDPVYKSIGFHSNNDRSIIRKYSHHPFVNERILIHYFKTAELRYSIHFPSVDESHYANHRANAKQNIASNTLINKFQKKTINSRTLVLYAFHEYNDGVSNFIDNCLFYDDNVDFLMINNSLDSKLNVPNYVKIINRENIGFDFGAWSYGLLHNDTYKDYDYFIYLNSSVIGPYLPMYYSGKWTDIFIEGLTDEIKLFGCTINAHVNLNNGIPHVQSYCFSMNKETLDFLIAEHLFSMSNYTATLIETVYTKEIKMSELIINNGWNIGCLMKYYYGIDFRLPVHLRGCKQLADMMYDAAFEAKFFKSFEEIVFIKRNRSINFMRNSDINFSFGGR